MKGFQSPEAEGNFEVITDDITVNMDGGVGGSWKVNEVETQTSILQKKAGTYPVEKGNATMNKGWRTTNALSE